MAVVSFKCPNCDGDLRFDPGTQKYKCEYCFSEFDQKELDAMRPDSATEQTAASDTEESGTAAASGGAAQAGAAVIYTCPSCGAEIVTDDTTAATFCYYCHNPVVLSGRLSGKDLPGHVLPFSVTKEQATEQFLNFTRKKKFIPRDFFNKKQIETLSGVYFPYWMLDSEMSGGISGEARRVRTWISGHEEYTETRFFHVVREGKVAANDLTHIALKKANSKLAEGIFPYDFSGLKPFSMGYLSGFLAEKKDLERADVENGMKSEMQKYSETLMREQITGYTSVNVTNNTLRFTKAEFDYVLLPLWTVTYRGNDNKTYFYSINGQTGAICGELPISWGRLLSVAGAFAGIVFGIVLLLGYLL